MLSSEELLDLQKRVAQLVVDESKPALAAWNSPTAFTLKEDKTPVTELDVQIEQSLRAKLSELLPGSGFIVEEGQDSTGEYVWIIDPIDNTRNFIYQVPIFYSQVALVHHDKPLLGVIYNPASQQLFEASLGNGAVLNKNRLLLSSSANDYIDIDFGSSDHDNLWKLPVLTTLIKKDIKFRMTGAAYAAYSVTNAIQAYLVLNQGTKAVDQYPRQIIMTEYGLQYDRKILAGKHIIVAARKQLSEQLFDLVDYCLKEQ